MAKALRWDVLVGALLIAVFAAGSLTSPSFATVDNLSFALGDLGEIALIALALDDPPEPFAYAVLAGTAALLIALGFAVADFISYEVRLKPAAPAGRSRK